MNVLELIAILQTQDPAARVVVAGWHFGYDDVAAVDAVTIAPAPSDAEDWDGAFAAVDIGEAAVFIKRLRVPKLL